MKELMDMLKRAGGLHDKIAQSVPELARGQVWCQTCGKTQKVNSAECLRTGWPKCCGGTMSIDAPARSTDSTGE